MAYLPVGRRKEEIRCRSQGRSERRVEVRVYEEGMGGGDRIGCP